MTKASIASQRLKRVPYRVTEVEDAARTSIRARRIFAFIGSAARRFEGAVEPDKIFELRRDRDPLSLDLRKIFGCLLEEFPAADRSLLKAFAPARCQLARRQSFESLDVGDNCSRLLKRTRSILSTGEINADLAANRGIDLRDQ